MKKIVLLLLSLALCFALAACGGQSAPAETPAPTPELTPEATPEPTPEPTPQLFQFPDGSSHYDDETELSLPELTSAQVDTVLPYLEQMPELRFVDLGNNFDDGEEPRLSWAAIRKLQEARPDVDFLYTFEFFGYDYTTLDTMLDFNHFTMYDEGAAVKEMLPCMTKCTTLDMDSCNVSSEAMAEIRDAYPNINVIWRIWFGTNCSIRTDAERILASNLDHHLTDENTKDLKYATKIKYIDIGHNTDLHDISFLGYMPDLEVAVIAICPWRDLSPIANCKNLEYLECSEYFLEPGEVTDLAPLGELPNLKELDICKIWHVKNYEALKKLTTLDRLWIGCYTDIPAEFIPELQEALPNTEINTTEQTGSIGTWRYNADGSNKPRYALLREQFQYEYYTAVSSYFANDPLFYSHDDNRTKHVDPEPQVQ